MSDKTGLVAGKQINIALENYCGGVTVMHVPAYAGDAWGFKRWGEDGEVFYTTRPFTAYVPRYVMKVEPNK